MPAAALDSEARAMLRTLFTGKKSHRAETDAYSLDFDAVGFIPSFSWCPDGARLREIRPASPSQARGCHFLYELHTSGEDGWALAVGAVVETRAMRYRMELTGPTAAEVVDLADRASRPAARCRGNPGGRSAALRLASRPMTDRTVRLHRVLRTPPAKLYRAFLEADALAALVEPDIQG